MPAKPDPISPPIASSPWAALPRGALVGLFVMTLLVRGAGLVQFGLPSEHDPDGYLRLAENLWQTGVFGYDGSPTATRPPLYPLLLLPCVAKPAWTARTVAVLHILLGLATVLATADLAFRWGLKRWAWLAALLVAVDPLLVVQASQAMTESLATLLAALALGSLAGGWQRPRMAWAISAGVSLGLAVLCRPSLAPFAALSVVLIAGGHDASGMRRSAMALAVAIFLALTLAPWWARNAGTFSRLIALSTHGGYTLLLGNNPWFYEHLARRDGTIWTSQKLEQERLTRERATPWPNEWTADRAYYRQALEAIRSDPRGFVHACGHRLRRFWGLGPLGTSALSGQAWWMAQGVRMWYVAQFALASVAVLRLRGRLCNSAWRFGVALVVSLLVVHAVYWTDLRMRAPVVPVLACLAALGAARLAGLFLSRQDVC